MELLALREQSIKTTRGVTIRRLREIVDELNKLQKIIQKNIDKNEEKIATGRSVAIGGTLLTTLGTWATIASLGLAAPIMVAGVATAAAGSVAKVRADNAEIDIPNIPSSKMTDVKTDLDKGQRTYKQDKRKRNGIKKNSKRDR